ncbi:MAG: ZmpA/ZmpB/ZmpC family metallo-endopeptidase-related protein, partial [Bacteroidales bacterium]|nr:ZmpA/ZmpB/ZmpC family metallo-endopeptidase-related protein [Bacteroidales bacterium]
MFITFINNAKADNIAISTCEELRDMSPLSGDFYLTQDINCSDTSTWNSGSGWIPLGTFTGNLDGQDFAITNLYIDRSSTDYVGLFSEITGGNIFNLSLTNVDITGQDYVGGLAGTITASSTIENITISGSITGNSELGGIAGDSYDSSFEDCISSINVTGTYNQGSVGGLLGSVYDGTTITSCSASGDISGGYSA